MIKEKADLHYVGGGSDKVYHAAIEEISTNQYAVTFSYGRRGSSLTSGNKTSGTVSYTEAKKVFDKLVRSKTSKGYKYMNGGGTPTTSSVKAAIDDYEQRDTGVRPQLLNEIPEEEVEKYLRDDEWCAQEKYDGRRRMFVKSDGKVHATNRKGLTVVVDQSHVEELTEHKLSRFIIDGEDMGDHVRVFDMLQPGKSYLDRYSELVLNFAKCRHLRIVHTAWSEDQKRDLLAKLKAENAEGIVFKRIQSFYTPGRPNSGGDQLKFKFVATATCFVRGINPTKRSIELAVFKGKHDDEVISVGNCTVYPNQEIPEVGNLVEIRYLYYFPGGSLFQPVLLGPREDLDIADCTLDQLKVKRDG